MPSTFEQWPWLGPLLRAGITVAGAYLFGRAMNIFVIGRMARLARRSHGLWDDIVIRELASRIPLWFTLIGVWVSLGYWPIGDRWLRLASAVILIAGFGSVTFALAAIATQLVAAYGLRAVPGAPVSGLTQNLVRLIVIALGLLVLLNQLGIEIRPMLAALGVGGLAVALALQEPLSNLFAGLFVSLAGQVRIGDQVRLDSGVEGRIVDFNWRSTWLEIPSGNIAVVPNAKLSQAIVTNFNLPTTAVNVPVEIAVDHRSDAAQVEAIALDVARGVLQELDGAVGDFEPIVRFHTFTDTGLRATVALRAKSMASLPLVRHTFIVRVHERFQKAGITPPTPAPVVAPPPAAH
jgi:small-conductance mechanosensitive channel